MATNRIDSGALNLDLSLCKKYFYNVKMKLVGLDNPDLKNRNINTLIIDADFRNSMTPIYNIKLTLSAKKYNELITKKDSIEIKLTLEHLLSQLKYDQSNLMDQFEEQGLNYIKNFEATYQPFLDHLPSLYELDMLNNPDSGVDPLNKEDIENTDASFGMVNRNIMNSMKAVSNVVLKDCNIGDCMGVILQKSGLKKLMICPPENDTQYSQLIVPPNNLVNNLEFLQSNYGAFKTGMRKFIDSSETMYLLSNDKGVLPVKAGEYNTVQIITFSKDDNRGMQNCCYKDDENKIYKVLTNRPPLNITSNASTQKEIQGNKLAFSNPKDTKYGTKYDGAGNFNFGSGMQITAPNIKGDVAGDDKVQFMENDFDNPMLESQAQYAMEESNQIIEMEFEDLDIDLFTVNKKFKFTFEESQYKSLEGDYMLDQAVFQFTRGTNEYSMKCIIHARFRLWNTFKSNSTRS